MEENLQHEDLLIKLRAKLNEAKIKLWESPFIDDDNNATKSLEDLARKLSSEITANYDTVVEALRELQLHSVDRSKANEEFKETGIATLRVKAVLTGQKPKTIKSQKKLQEMGVELISEVANDLNVSISRVKLICNGKVIKPSPSLEEQGLKNGSQVMALIMTETPEEMITEDNMYKEMATTRDDAALLSEYMDLQGPGDEYMMLEDQSGAAVELPAAERRSIVVGLALHDRGRSAAKERDYPLALVLLLEADRQFSECSSDVLKKVDNWAVLQLDIAWCYLCLQNLASASDASRRLEQAERCFKNSYGENYERLIALKGTAANERVLLMRLYLLQGIVCYHQNRRAEAKRLLSQAERELSGLKVDEASVGALMELGWSRAQAVRGLRAAAGDRDGAHLYLERRRSERDAHRQTRAQQSLRPTLSESESESSEETSESASNESVVEADSKLVDQLEAMGYSRKDGEMALLYCQNQLEKAFDMLAAADGCLTDEFGNPTNPSTSAEVAKKRKPKTKSDDKRKKSRDERKKALDRLKSTIKSEEDDHLASSLAEEEEFLAQYKSLL